MLCEEIVNASRSSIQNIENVRIYVPDNLVEAYKSDTTIDGKTKYYAWSTYAAQIFPVSQWQADIDNRIISL